MLARMIRQSLARNARITAWSLATLTASAALATLFFAMSIDVGEEMTASLRKLGANAVAHAPARPQAAAPGAGPADPWGELQAMARARGADAAVLRLAVGTVQGAPVAVVSADPAALARLTPYWAIQGARPSGPGACLMGRRLAAALGAAVGSTVEVHLPGRAAPERLRVAGVLESGDEDEGRMFVAGAPSPGGPRYTYALLSVPGGEAALAGMGAAIAGLGLELSPLRQVLHGEQAVIARIDLLTGIALAVVVLLGALGVTAAVLARVLERRRELALLQALGATRRSVATFLLCEGAVTGAVAAVLGYAAGTALSRAVARQVFGVAPAPHLAPLLAAAAVSVVIAVAAAAVGARRALRLETAALLKGE